MVKGALDFSLSFSVVSNGIMPIEVGVCVGIFLALCLHFMPLVDTWFGQVPRFSKCVFLLILLLCQAVNFFLIVANYFVGLFLSSFQNREIGELRDITVQIQQMPNSPGDSKHQT